MLAPTPLARLALAATLASALTAQATGRTITTVAPANLGATAQYRANYPNTEAGNFGWYLMAGHQVGTVPVPIPGFTVYGSCRVDPAVLFQTYFFLMDVTGANTLSLTVPNSITFFGFPFDLQTLDANLFTGELSWGDNDAEVVVGPGAQGPLPSANMVVIPAGSFAMGSSAASGAPYFPQANERPVHPVTISRQFWMGKYEVTQAEYQAVMGTNPSFHQGASYPNSGNRPVEQVSYDQAMTYCTLLTASERAAGRVPVGWVYRLPTEAEWEYACRATTSTEYSMGTALSCPVANYSTCVGQTAVVGSYAANAFGLYDMHGNVAEWCLDAWDGSANYSASAATDPLVTTGSTRILRGGALGYQPYACRSATRSGLAPSLTSVNCGFRVVCAPILTIPLPNFVAISAGTFAMGSTAGNANEQPIHQVTLSRAFWMGKYEVTQAEYQAVMGNNPSSFLGASRPVEHVTWSNAVAYCTALTNTERAAGRLSSGYEYRLPTEAEWEYCCRAATTTEWNTGTSLSAQQANFNQAIGQTTTVGSYAANAFGLFDMHGNVWEWCLDSWDGSNNYPSSAATDPYVSSGPYRVFRGGGWFNISSDCRSAFRYNNRLPTIALNDNGFRVVCAPVVATPTTPLPNFVAIPAGTFAMGSTAGQANEQPVHQVTISRPFWMGKHEVTQAEYQAVMGSNPSSFVGANRPVEQVSWHNAMAYCAALTTAERAAGRLAPGYEYRLPTEAEWEYCCRAGTTTEWNTGTGLSTQQANFTYSINQTTTVGSYAANAFGLFDMHGNVWEWCMDAWDGSNNYPASVVTDPYVSSGTGRVHRGGSWGDNSDGCRSAYRNLVNPTYANFYLGFRVVCAPVRP